MNAEFWAIIGVGLAVSGLQWRLYASLSARLGRIEADLTNIKERLSRLEGWTAAQLGHEIPPPA